MTSVSEPTTPVSSQPDPVKENAAPGSSTQALLYLRGLDSSVTETDLSYLFVQVGTVLSVKVVKVCTYDISNVSRRYGYVHYCDSKDAKNAMDLLNGELLNGKPMRIMFLNRDPSSWKVGASIFVKFFDKSLSSKNLDATFAAFGSVLASNFPTGSNGLLEGHGCVQFEQEEDAQQVRRLDGMLMGDGQVFVRPYLSKKERVKKKRENCLAEQRFSKLSKVIVRNLPEKVETDEFEFFFDFYGPVFCASIVRDKKGCSRGFGFVRYFRLECAARAIAGLNGTPWYGKTIYVEYAKCKFERRVEFELKRSCRFEELQGTKLYMENIDDSINEEKLKDLFSEFGKITNCKVWHSFQGVNIGRGFVAFSNPEDATKAMKELNGRMIARKPLYICPQIEWKAMPQVHIAQIQAPVVPSGLEHGRNSTDQGQPGQQMDVSIGGTPQQMLPDLLVQCHGCRNMSKARKRMDPCIVPQCPMSSTLPLSFQEVAMVPVDGQQSESVQSSTFGHVCKRTEMAPATLYRFSIRDC